MENKGFDFSIGHTASWWNVAFNGSHYKNKIVSSNTAEFRLANGRRVQNWENSGKAVVEGVEGNLFVTLSPTLEWNTNFTYMIESKDKDSGEPAERSQLTKRVKTLITGRMTPSAALVLATSYAERKKISVVYADQD